MTASRAEPLRFVPDSPPVPGPGASGTVSVLEPARSLTHQSPGPALAPDDAQRVARLCAGEREALAEIYDAHHEALRAFGVRLLGDAATAEDLVHDVFVTLPIALRRFRGDCALRTFLMSIAVNQARSHVRNAERRRRALERYSELPPSHDAGPERELHARRELHALRAGLLALPVAQSVAFVLCEIEHLPAAEAARIMGVPEATARTRVWHARRKLRQWLGEGGP
jgi:RNA polymerase sigma-70 factor (ECF subfamily)